MDNQLPEGFTIDDKSYKTEDLDKDGKLLLANILENNHLLAFKQSEMKQLQIAAQALEANLKMKAEGMSFTEIVEAD